MGEQATAGRIDNRQTPHGDSVGTLARPLIHPVDKLAVLPLCTFQRWKSAVPAALKGAKP
jgi:hypothetical protein